MREEKVDLYSSITSAILGTIGVVSSGEIASVAAVGSYLPAIFIDKIKHINKEISFDNLIEKQIILALDGACKSTEKHLQQRNAKNLFQLAAIEIRKACEIGESLEETIYTLHHMLSELQKKLESDGKYEEWLTPNNLKEITKVYRDELNKIISNDYHELGIYLLLSENIDISEKGEDQLKILISHEKRIEEIEKNNQSKDKTINIGRNCKKENEYERIFNIISVYYFKDIKKNNSSLYLLEINNNLFPELSDDIGIKYIDNHSNEIPLFKYVVEKWVERNSEINLLLTAEGGMGKTVSLFKCCKLILNRKIMCIYIPLYHMDKSTPNNIEKFIFKYVFRNDKDNFDVFLKYIRQSSLSIRLVLLLDGFNEVSDNIKNVLIKEIRDFLMLDCVRLIITSRYDFRYNYGLFHQFKHLIIQQLSEESILNYLRSCKVKISSDNVSLLELLGFPLLISLYAQTEKYYVKSKNLSFIEWYDKVDNAGKIIWNYLQCQILKPLFNMQDERICYLIICINYIVPYVSWYMILQKKFFLTEEQFVLKLNESLEYYRERWRERKPLIIQKVEMLSAQGDLQWSNNLYYKLMINYVHIFNRNIEGEYSLIHHRFRDCFGAIFLMNEISSLEWKTLPIQFKNLIDNDVLDFIIDLVDKNKILKLWSNYRYKNLGEKNYELKNLYYIICRNYKNEVTFENLDLRNVLINKEDIQKSKNCFNGSYINYNTFVPNELDSSILCMCILEKREICICGLSDYTVRIWGINYGTFLYVLKGHKGKVTSLAYSPNEKLCLSGSEDCTLILWDIDKGEKIIVLTGHESEIVKIKFIDNVVVKSFSSDGIMRTWDIQKEICINIERYNMSEIIENKNSNIALLDDGSILINNNVKLIGHKKKVIDYAYVSRKNKFLSLSLDKSVKIWNLSEGKCVHTLTGFSEWENVIDISFENKICVSGAYDETIRLWDIEKGHCKRVLYGHTDFLSSIKLTHDATKCISGSYDNTAKIWDLSTGKCLFTLKGHTQYVRKVDCTKDDKYCVTASYDGLLKVWEIDTGHLIHTLEGHTKGVRAFTLSDDGKYCLSGARDFTAKLWSLESGKCLYTLKKHPGHIRSVKIEKEICLTSCTDKKIRKWDINSGELKETYDLSHLNMPNPNLSFFYKQDCIIYFNDGEVIIYNYINHNIIEKINHIKEDNYNISDMGNILLSSDGRYCVSGSYNYFVNIYDLYEDKYLLRLKAIPYVDLIGISFYNAKFENDELKNIVFMSGGLI